MSDTYDVTSVQFSEFAADEMGWEDRTEAQFVCEGYELTGKVLGFGTSRDLTGHNGHPDWAPPVEGKRCSACRWAEICLLWVRAPGSETSTYAVVTMGKTIVAEEVTRVKTFWTEEAFAVLEKLYVSGPNGTNRRIPLPNARAFRMAAEVDAGIRTVLADWESAIPDPDDREDAPQF